MNRRTAFWREQAADMDTTEIYPWLVLSESTELLYKTIPKLTPQKNHMRIVADQVDTPTHSRVIAKANTNILQQFNSSQHGLYHLNNGGQSSWHALSDWHNEQQGVMDKLTIKTLVLHPQATKKNCPAPSLMEKT